MRAVVIETPGDESVLRIGEAETPSLSAGELRIAVRATAVNRADLLQREGKYPPPPGASPILGLECAGVVTEVGAGVSGWKAGDRAMALLAGGGYAAEAVVPAAAAMHVPESLSDEEAAAIPEVFLTAYLNIFMLAAAQAGETVLIHGGGSGVGTAGTTLCKLAGMRVIVTAGSAEKCARCLGHGADLAINYREEDFVEKASGANVILDHIGARYLQRDIDTVAVDGRIVLIGSMGGQRTAEIDVAKVLGRRIRIIGSTLRSRTVEEKGAIVDSFLAKFGEDLREGRVRPVVHSVMPLERVAEAHRLMAASDHFGKIVLVVSRG